MIVMKFGGASLGTGEKIARAAETVRAAAESKTVVVVVSAMRGTTDTLVSLFRECESGLDATPGLEELRRGHLAALRALGLEGGMHQRVKEALLDALAQLASFLAVPREYSLADHDYVVSTGERLSSLLFAAALAHLGVRSQAVDSARAIVTSEEFTQARALLPETRVKAREALLPLLAQGIVPVVTGYYGATRGGRIATLGRGGSDYSATILGDVLDAEEVILWKEVDGVFTGDPHGEKSSTWLPELSYEEAGRLARNGAKVLHPEALTPVSSRGIVVWVRNIAKVGLAGTKIWNRAL